MKEPRLAYGNRMYGPQDEMTPFMAEKVMSETSFTSLMYGYGSAGMLDVYNSDESETIGLDKLYEDAVALSLGVLTIPLPHFGTCNRLICNCKIM
jgi:hypothetical protein